MQSTRYVTPTGVYWLPDDTPNCPICKAIKAGEVYDAAIMDALKPYVRPDSTVVDMGACFGQMSIIWSRMAAKVVSIEADACVAELLKKNIQENERTNIEVHECVAWNDSQQWMDFPVPDVVGSYPCYGCFGVTANEFVKEYAQVRTLTIDSLRLENVSVIKSDVQGADLQALEGAVLTITHCRPAIVFEFEEAFAHKLGAEWRDYASFVDRIGYKIEKELPFRNYLVVPK